MTQNKLTYLKISWSCPANNSHHEEVWERKNDGVLYTLFQQIVSLIHTMEKLGKKK
jgi:hypothetical protein